jgi:hypothetical protein
MNRYKRLFFVILLTIGTVGLIVGMEKPIFSTNYPGGLVAFIDRTIYEGDVWFVDSTATGGSDASGYGLHPDAPFATLVYAKTAVSAGDTIFVMPGHTETLTGNPSLTLDVARLHIIGLGGYSTKPAFLIDGANTAHILMSGADCILENVTLNAGHGDIAKAIDVKANGIIVRKCSFFANTVDENFLIAVNIGTGNNDSDGCIIEDNIIYQLDAAATQAIKLVKDQNNVTIQRNRIQGNYAAGYIIGSPDTENFLNLMVLDNIIDNDANDTVCVIKFAGTNTGVLSGNLSGDEDADGTPFIGTGLSVIDNYHTGAVTKSGYLYPAADS